MKKILICFLFLSHSFIITAQLSLTLPINSNDKYWSEDANIANANANHFVEPEDSINYTDYRYVGAHNAFDYHPHFFKIAYQQDQTILGQLTFGVRGFMLDTYNWTLGWPNSLVGPQGAKVCLSHAEPGFVAFIQKGTTVYQSLKFELRRIVEFMKANPQAVITIIIEDYADTSRTTKEIKEVMQEAQYNPLFTPSDLHYEWPTLGWMRTNNKRLVIFTQRATSTDITFHQFTYMAENQYDTTDENQLCTPRAESYAAGPLVAFNNFKGTGITPPVLFTSHQVCYETAKKVTTNCQAKQFADGKLFNGYWADRIIDSCNALYVLNQKTIFEYVNELNANPNKGMFNH